jgi:hypothetical protein
MRRIGNADGFRARVARRGAKGDETLVRGAPYCSGEFARDAAARIRSRASLGSTLATLVRPQAAAEGEVVRSERAWVVRHGAAGRMARAHLLRHVALALVPAAFASHGR